MSFAHYESRKARKAHRCDDCFCAIQPGQRYHLWRGPDDGRWCSFVRCDTCSQWRSVFVALAGRDIVESYDYDGDRHLLAVARDMTGNDWTELAFWYGLQRALVEKYAKVTP